MSTPPKNGRSNTPPPPKSALPATDVAARPSRDIESAAVVCVRAGAVVVVLLRGGVIPCAANRSLDSIGSMKQMWVRSARRAVRKEGLGNGPLGHLVGLEKGLGVIVYLTQPVWPYRIPYEVAMMKFC